VAPYSLNLAETYSLVGAYLDKSDNLHFNGDYQKVLICFHVVYYIFPDFDSLKIPSLQLSEYPFVMKLKIFQGESLHFGHLCGHVYP